MARPRVGLVLGAGGVLGGAWLVGGLHALARETGWDPADADVVVGTSAGSMVGALLAAGVPPWFMVAHSAGEDFDGLTDARGIPAQEADRSAGAVFRLHRGLPAFGPGSWRLIGAGLTRLGPRSPSAILCGALPQGVISTEPLRDTVRRVVPEGWAPRALWVVACDYANGRRTVFGRSDAPEAELADAVAASCAIPGFYRPVAIAGRRYVDGGLWSTSNLDVLAREELDLVVCLNPTSTLHPPRAWNPFDRAAHLVRRGSGRLLGSEARRLREQGTRVVLVQPTGDDLAVMGVNLMSSRRRHEVLETAIETVGAQVRSAIADGTLAGLPAGAPEKIARPPGPPSQWPALEALGA